MPKTNEAVHDEQALRALGASLPINADQWQNVKSSQDFLNAFYDSGNFYPGIYIKELVRITGLPKSTIYYRFNKWQKRDRQAGIVVLNTPIRFNARQQQILSQAYQENPYPSSQKKVGLSVLTRLTKQQVKQWFVTKRRGDRRREQRYALQNGAGAMGDEGNGNNQN